ncbi:unnamed protein product [Chrysoparadoxa australica]
MKQLLEGDNPTAAWIKSVVISPGDLRVPDVYAGATAYMKGRGFSQCPQSSLSLATATASATAAPTAAGTATSSLTGFGNGAGVSSSIQTKLTRRVDGFALLCGGKVDLPDHAYCADISGGGFNGVVEADLAYFTKLEELDAGDNDLYIEDFGSLPSLRRLALHCNNITTIGECSGFKQLLTLDLSYNSLDAAAVAALGQLRSLQELDLTCNGLEELPYELTLLTDLRKMRLERNQLEGSEVLRVLSCLQSLSYLSLAFNYFSIIELDLDSSSAMPPSSSGEVLPAPSRHQLFPQLDVLDLSFNYIADEEDAMAVTHLARLERVILYGNPLCGPDGEDPLCLCVEGLIKYADEVRVAGSTPILEVITEMPRKKLPKLGKGRRRPYTDIGITMATEDRLPLAKSFKAAGNEHLFSFEKIDQPMSIVEATLAGLRDMKSSRSTRQTLTQGGRVRVEGATFMTEVDESEEEAWDLQNELLKLADASLVPGDLGKRTLDRGIQGAPAKLRMAIASLKHALKHPLMSTKDPIRLRRRSKNTPGTWEVVTQSEHRRVDRATTARRAKDVPRRTYELRKLARKEKKENQAVRAESLRRMEQVVDSMNDGVDGMALEKRALGPNTPRQPGMSCLVGMVNAIMDEIDSVPDPHVPSKPISGQT